MLNTEEKYQEITNSDGTVFFVETSDNVKFHIFDKGTNELLGKVVTENSADLTDQVYNMIEECSLKNTSA
jgi:hypothetical protein